MTGQGTSGKHYITHQDMRKDLHLERTRNPQRTPSQIWQVTLWIPRVTIGFHTYNTNLNGKGECTKEPEWMSKRNVDSMRLQYTLLWMDYPYDDYIQATMWTAVTGQIHSKNHSTYFQSYWVALRYKLYDSLKHVHTWMISRMRIQEDFMMMQAW